MFSLTFFPFVFEKVRGLVLGKVKAKVEERAKRWWYGPPTPLQTDKTESDYNDNNVTFIINYNGQSHVFSDM